MSQRLSITMISNGMSHHQMPFCEYMEGNEGVDFHFIATKPLSEERASMGYKDLNFSGDYIVRSYECKESMEKAIQLAEKSDFVIYGSAPYSFVKNRLKQKKWTFIYSERIFKKGFMNIITWKHALAYFKRYFFVSHGRLCLLCASAYAASDFRYFRFKENKAYKWGYFPPDTYRDIDSLFAEKKENSIVWVGRMISWKHPELVVALAEKLKGTGIPFRLTMIGDGFMFEAIQKMVRDRKLEHVIKITGALPTEEVRTIMEQSEILLATSDYEEGWGAVVNEGMNSACAVVGSAAMGSVPFLITDGVNGLMFKSGDADELFQKVCHLLENKEKRREIGKNAYHTIKNEWNGQIAGKRLVTLCKELHAGNEACCYEEGICSRAE